MPDLTPFREVAAIIADELGIEALRVTPETLLRDDLSCDCLHIMSIACSLDIAFGIEIPDDVLERCNTALDLAKAVAGLRRAAA